MSLDLLSLGGQARAMSHDLRDEIARLPDRIAAARATLAAEAHEWEYWRDEVEAQSRTAAWLTAQPLEPLDATYDLPPCPAAYAVAAADGSQLDIDHHGIVACWVINIGTALLQYGLDAAYRAASRPLLGYRDDDLYLRDDANGREYAIEGQLLAARRDVEEGLALAALAQTLPADRPRLVLQDGTLIRWTLSSLDEFVRNHFLQQYLNQLDTMRSLPCPVASYLSRPRSREVIGLARLLLVRGNYQDWRARYPTRRDDPTRGLVDTLLFEHLQDGQRSARWASTSRINVEYYGEHRIQFFYLRVGREIARVEFPAWVAAPDQLELLHALVYDQCRRGPGYPNVLARAHEQAVIHSAERRHLAALIERQLIRADLPVARSAKAGSKLRPSA